MKRVLAHIKKRNDEFAQAPLFHFLADATVAPAQKLALAPCMAHFVFSFMDINRFVLRDTASQDELQQLVNIHTREDADHWPWYLEDLRKLGLDKLLPLTDALHFIWGDHGIASRLLTYRMVALIGKASSKEKIMIVEAIEMTGNVFLSHTARVCAVIPGGDHYAYYGAHHYQRETGHHMGCQDVEDRLHRIALTDNEVQKGLALIDEVYALYRAFVDEMHRYASIHDMATLRQSERYHSTIRTDDPEV